MLLPLDAGRGRGLDCRPPLNCGPTVQKEGLPFGSKGIVLGEKEVGALPGRSIPMIIRGGPGAWGPLRGEGCRE